MRGMPLSSQSTGWANRALRWARALAPWAFTGLVVWFLVTQIELDTLWPLVSDFSWAWFGAGLIFYVLANLFRDVRTWLLLGTDPRQLPALLPVFFVVSLANNGLPARMGEVVYVYYINRILKIGAGSATAGVIAVRVFDYLTVAALFVFSWGLLADSLTVAGGEVALLTLPVLLVGVVGLAALPWVGGWLLPWVTRLMARLRLERFIPMIERQGGRAVATLAHLRDLRQYGRMFGSSLAIWSMTYLWYTCFLAALHFEASLPAIVFGATFAVLTKAIPLASIGGFGTHEAGWTVGFMLVGFDLSAAVLSGLAVNVLTLLASALFGVPSWIYLWWQGRRSGSTEQASGPTPGP